MHPLEDIIVIDATQALVGPLATQILGDFGAEVIKIERPKVGDNARSFATEYNEMSAYFSSLNRNKKSITLNLTSEKGQEILHEFVEEGDVFIHNFTPGNEKKFDADYEKLSNIKEDIIYCSLSGYGDNSPYSERRLFDLVGQGESGLMSVTGTEDGEPVRIGVSLVDISGGVTAAYSILAALYHRSNTGEGQYIDIALLDTGFYFLLYHITNYFATGENPEMMGMKHPNLTPYQGVETKDSYMIVAVASEVQWPRLCRAIGKEEWIDDERFATFEDRTKNRDVFDKLIDEVFAEKTTEEWLELLREKNIPCAPINQLEDIVDDPHIEARNMIEEVEHPELGTFKVPGVPTKFSDLEADVRTAPPRLGEHTDQVLKDFGYSEDEIQQFRENDII